MNMDICPENLLPFLKTGFIGRQMVSREELESTNITAIELGEAGAAGGLLVAADHQTGGRGRSGRSWFSPAGRNLYFSILLRPECSPGAIPQLAIVAALSLRDSIAEVCPEVNAGVKWPNDLLVDGAKLSGILCSMSAIGDRAEYAIVGIGVNVNLEKHEIPEEIPATSLKMLSGREVSRSLVLASFLNVFEKDYLDWIHYGSLEPFIERWRKCSCLDGSHVVVEQGSRLLSGTADGITDDGRLRLLDENGAVVLACAGDAHIRR